MATATATAGTFLPANAGNAPMATRSGNDRRMASTDQGDGAFTDVTGPGADFSGPFGPIKQILSQPAVKKSLPRCALAAMTPFSVPLM